MQQQFSSSFDGRICCVTEEMCADELKNVIGHCDFFRGARMHSCIAAASQCIPTVVLAYSPKAKSVFGMINNESAVVDLKRASTEEVVEQTKAIFDRRDALAKHLQAQIPATKQVVRSFFFERLSSVLTGLSAGGRENSKPVLADRGEHSPRSVVES